MPVRTRSLVVLVGLLAGLPAHASLPSLSRYFSQAELAAGHPAPAEGLVYHGASHTRNVRKMAFDLARARQRSKQDAVFISEVALLHDWDPSRTPGTPARVPATLAALQADFDGTAPLVRGYQGRSVLRERFGWDAGKLAMAIAMIQRTEFPFGDEHPSPAYAGTSPKARYAAQLTQLTRAQRRFVLAEGPLLSEYADQASFPSMRSYSGAARAQRGLADEINRVIGKKKMGPVELDSAAFMSAIGKKERFTFDHGLAARFGETLALPTVHEAFSLLPATYGARFRANLTGWKAFMRAAKSGTALTTAYRFGRAASLRSKKH